MNVQQRATAVIVLVVFLLGLIGIVYFAGRLVAAELAQLDRNVAVITVIAALTILTAARLLAGGERHARQEERLNELQSQKMKLYFQLVERWSQSLGTPGKTDAPGEGKLIEDDFLEARMVLIASPDVVKQCSAIRRLNFGLKSEILPVIKAAIIAMRKDLQIPGTLDDGLLDLLPPRS